MKTTAHSHIVRTAVGRVGLCKQFYALDPGSNLLVPFFFFSHFFRLQAVVTQFFNTILDKHHSSRAVT